MPARRARARRRGTGGDGAAALPRRCATPTGPSTRNPRSARRSSGGGCGPASIASAPGGISGWSRFTGSRSTRLASRTSGSRSRSAPTSATTTGPTPRRMSEAVGSATCSTLRCAADSASCGKSQVLSGILPENRAGAGFHRAWSRQLGSVASVSVWRWRLARSSVPAVYIGSLRPMQRTRCA